MTVRNSYPDHAAPGSSPQDGELLLLDAASIGDLRGQFALLAELSTSLPPAGLGPLAATLRRGLAGHPVRAAVVAASGQQAAHRFARLLATLDSGARAVMDVAGGIFLGEAAAAPGIGFMFPGQGSGKNHDGGALARRFGTVHDLYQTATLPPSEDPTATEVAQPRITIASAAGLRAMSLLGIEATAAVGHSLGELTALHWAGAMTEEELFELAAERGRVMAQASEGGGAMAGIGAGPDDVGPLLSGEPVVIGGYNGPAQTVISGPAEAVERVRGAAAELGFKTARVRVSHAFHSPLVAPAATKLDVYLASREFRPLARRVVSTLTGDVLPVGADLRQLLVRQVCEPVRFSQALSRMASDVSLLIEVGPGRVLSGLAAKITPDIPVIPLSTDGSSLTGVLSAAAAAYVLGVAVRHDLLLADPLAAPGPGGGAVAGVPAQLAGLAGDGAGSRP